MIVMANTGAQVQGRPKSIDDIMPHARDLVSNKAGLGDIPWPGSGYASVGRRSPDYYGASLQSQNLDGKAFVEVWVRIPGKGEFFSRGLNRPITGTMSWMTGNPPSR